MQPKRKDSQDAEEYATRGPFSNVFGGPAARLLDQALIVGNMEQTITMLAESTNQTYKTTKTALQKLQKISFVAPTRKIGNTQTYKLQTQNHLSTLLTCGAEYQQNPNRHLKTNRVTSKPTCR